MNKSIKLSDDAEEQFVKHMTSEMSWNCGSIEWFEGNPAESGQNGFFCYSGAPGSSLKPELTEAAAEFGAKVKISRCGDTSKRADSHEYMIFVTDLIQK